jgi:hypothetical protein
MREIQICVLIVVIASLLCGTRNAVTKMEAESIRQHDEELARKDAEWKADLHWQGLISQ